MVQSEEITQEIARKDTIQRLVDRGVLRVCRYCSKPLPTDHANRWYCNSTCRRLYRKGREKYRRNTVKWNRTLKQKEYTDGLKTARIARLLDNARRLMIYIAGEDKKGGLRQWFRKHDIECAGCCDIWAFSRGGDTWIDMMERLIAVGMVEKRKATEGSAGHKGERNYNEYRFVKLDKDFFDG